MNTNPPPFRTIRVLCAAIEVHEHLLKLAYEGGHEHWQIQRTLAALGRQLDEAEAVWARHNGREPVRPLILPKGAPPPMPPMPDRTSAMPGDRA